MEVILGVLAMALLAVLLITALLHRRRAKQAGDPVGSLWYHVQQSQREQEEQRRRKKAKKEEQRIAAANARHDANASASATTAPATSSSARPSKNQSKKIARDNAREARKIATSRQPLDEVQFVYRDQLGKQSQRRVSVAAIDEQYFEGHCHTRHATRTFITRRIVGDITRLTTGEIVRSKTWARQLRRHPHNCAIRFDSFSKPLAGRSDRRGRAWETAVYFVGFHGERRSQLEALAEDAGWQVRGGFSKSLDIMVAGTLAGSAQLAQAELGNIEVITEQEFRARMHAENNK